jgi:hypothetical protein
MTRIVRQSLARAIRSSRLLCSELFAVTQANAQALGNKHASETGVDFVRANVRASSPEYGDVIAGEES